MVSPSALKSTIDPVILNMGQQEAADGFFRFLLGAEPEIIISGPGGVGKTFLMGYLIDEIMPRYFQTCKLMAIEPEFDEVVMTATTNKAAEVLGLSTGRPTVTIHSFLNLTVKDDYSTGKSTLAKTQGWMVHEKKIIFLDEAYMTDTSLLTLLREGTHKCKIVFVGDHCQLAPIMEAVSPIHRAGLPFFSLTQNVRNAGQPALMQVCQQLRNTVETGIFKPIQIVPDVIDLADAEQMEEAIAHVFHEQTREARILAYTNKRCVEYNEHIRGIRGLPIEYGKGEFLVNNSAIRLKDQMLSVEEEVEIIDQFSHTENMEVDKEGTVIEVRRSTLRSRLGGIYRNVPLAVDRDHALALSKWYKAKKDWRHAYWIKDHIPDLRPRDAATVHKAQGSTYDVVFIDVSDISNCRQPNMAARLLYVAFTRARSRVILYGDLASKFGGLKH